MTASPVTSEVSGNSTIPSITPPDSLADGQFSCMSRSAATSDSVRTKTLPEDSAMSLWPTMPAKAVVTIPSPLKWRW